MSIASSISRQPGRQLLTIGIFAPETHLLGSLSHSTGTEAVPSGSIASLLVFPDTLHRYKVLYWHSVYALAVHGGMVAYEFFPIPFAVARLVEPVPRA